jgi:hypothetical protein
MRFKTSYKRNDKSEVKILEKAYAASGRLEGFKKTILGIKRGGT